VELKVFDESNARTWDDAVAKAEHGTIFHSWKWISAIQGHGCGKLHALVGVGEDGSPAAIVPLFLQKRIGLCLVFSPPPKSATPYLGPIIMGYSSMEQSRREAVLLEFQKLVQEYVRGEMRADYVFMLTPPGFPDIRQWQWSGYTASPLYEYTLDLKLGPDRLWENLKRNIRNEIKHTLKAGVRVRIGGREDYIGLVDDTKKRYMDQGIRETTSDMLMMELFERFYPDNMRILVAEHNGERVAGIVELIYRGSVLSWIGGVKSNTRGIFPNAFVHWESIRMAAESGADNYVEIGANTRHLCKFKRQFNHAPLQYFNLRSYPNPLLRAVEKGYVFVLKPLQSAWVKKPMADDDEEKDDG
jgi:hypothetical protein